MENLSLLRIQSLQTAAIKIGLDLGLFKYLTKSLEPLSVSEISQQTGADAELLGLIPPTQLLGVSNDFQLARILRYLATIGAVEDVAIDLYGSNHLTKNLTEKLTEAGINH